MDDNLEEQTTETEEEDCFTPVVYNNNYFKFEGAAIIWALIAVLGWATAVYEAKVKPPENPQCQLTSLTAQEQAKANKAQLDFNSLLQRHENELRIKIVEACANRGNIPVFINGNIDCKLSPK